MTRNLSAAAPDSRLSGEIRSAEIGQIIAEMIRPVMQTIGQILENNAAALEQLSAISSVTADRLEVLEKQIRLQTPVTGKQVSYLNDAIRQRSRELLDKRGVTDANAIRQLGNHIRKAVLSRYGIGCLREIPKHEYGVAMQQIGMWSDVLTVRDVIKEAERKEAMDSAELAGHPADTDGAQTIPRVDD